MDAAAEPTSFYGLIASAIVTLLGGSAGIWGYLQKRAKDTVDAEKKALTDERESNRNALNDAFHTLHAGNQSLRWRQE